MNLLFCLATIGFASLTAHATEQPNDSITCHVTGTVIDRPESKSMILIEAKSDLKVNKYDIAEINDGIFSFTIKDTVPRAYQIIFDDELKNNGWLNRYFYS